MVELRMLFALIAIAVSFKFARFIFTNLRIHLLSWRLPGPWGLPIIGSIHKLYEGSHVGLVWFLKEAAKLREQGKNIIVFNIFGRIYTIPITASAAKQMLESTELLTKGRDYDFIRAWLKNGLLTSDGDHWKAHRKMLTPTFHFQELNRHFNTFHAQANVLRQHANKKIDVYPYLKRCALDIICATTLGRSYGIQKQPDHKYVMYVEKFNSYVQRYSSEIHMWFPPLWYLLHHNTLQIVLKDLHKFTENAILGRMKERRNGIFVQDDRAAFLDILLDMYDKNEISKEEVQEEVDTIVFAGHDTTSATLGWLLWCLATNGEWQERVHEEIDRVLPEDDSEITAATLNQLHVLDRCIKESMRVYATAPFTERLVQKDTVIDGYTIPAGSEIFLSPMMLHHNSMVYHDDWKYDPDRFLPENVARRSVYDYVPFSAGPRNCLGQKFASLEVKVVAMTLLRSFRVSSTDEITSNTPAPEVILRPMNGISITLHER